MNREEFLKQLGITALLTCTGSAMIGCSNNDEPAPSNADFTLDLSASQNAALNNVGGSLSSNGIIVARLSNTEFVALSRACTHEGTGINFRSSQNDFLCPNHGARFSTTGAVLQGPARASLKKYNTELTGNSLRIFS
jgi:cytochrome b6-f complex iron-sulfur subunit